MNRFCRWSRVSPLLLCQEQERLAWRGAGISLALLLGLLGLGLGWAAPLRAVGAAGPAAFTGLHVPEGSAEAAPPSAESKGLLPQLALPVVDVPLPLPPVACAAAALPPEPWEWEDSSLPEEVLPAWALELPEVLPGGGFAQASSPRPPEPGAAGGAAAAEGVQPARYRSTPHPPYPPELLRRRVKGRVGLRIVVDAAGLPESVELSSPSGYAAFDRAAREWVLRHWRFYPALRGGVAVPSVVHSSVVFVLG